MKTIIGVVIAILGVMAFASTCYLTGWQYKNYKLSNKIMEQQMAIQDMQTVQKIATQLLRDTAVLAISGSDAELMALLKKNGITVNKQKN